MKKIFFFILGAIGALIGAAVIYVICFVIILGIVINGNASAARNEAKPFNQEMKQKGWEFICDFGGGDGVDSLPWYGMYYETTDSPELVTQIKDFSKKHGYSLVTDSEHIAELQKTQQFDPKTDYLIARSTQEHTLNVSIVRDEKTTIYCGTTKTITRDMIPTPGQAIIMLEIQTGR